MVSNSQFWYGEYDYSLKLSNFVDSPFNWAVCRRTTPISVDLQTLGGYALMNQSTTIEATETKMDHNSVISIKKGPFEPDLLISRTAPLNQSLCPVFVITQPRYLVKPKWSGFVITQLEPKV